jgi:Trk K+ transport system NAD-binding subunit
VIRGEGEIIPNGGTRLQVRDGLLVAATEESIQKFRALIEPPNAEGTSDEIVALD